MKAISFTQGRVALVDDEDFDELNLFKWFVSNNYEGLSYACRWENGRGSKRLYMHREILKPALGVEVDHKDRNGLNNCRSNLRICNCIQNQQNQKQHRDASSRFKGVDWATAAQKWRARIQIFGIRKHLGLFDSEEDVARAYVTAAQKYFGEFARA